MAKIQALIPALGIIFLSLLNAGCGNGGSIAFTRGPSSLPRVKPNSVILVPGGVDPALESGHTSTATGHSAKLQLNPIRGQTLTGSGYTMKVRYTNRTKQ